MFNVSEKGKSMVTQSNRMRGGRHLSRNWIWPALIVLALAVGAIIYNSGRNENAAIEPASGLTSTAATTNENANPAATYP